jgi:glycosyltransferase involved in cell wall biosynthesis
LRSLSVALVSNSPTVGVDRKLEYIRQAARTEGIPLDVISVDSTKGSTRPRGLLRRLFRASRRLKLEALMPVLESYDIVLLRFPKAPLNYMLVFRRYGYKIVTIHNTDEIGELSVKKKLKRRILVRLVRMIGSRLLRRVPGIIGVTEEIRRVEVLKARPNTPLSTVITNGIDVDSMPFTGFRCYDGLELHLVFVASHFQPWHGCDRLLAGLAHYHAGTVILHIVGEVDEELRLMAKDIGDSNRFLFHGPLTGDSLDSVMSQATLAVGSLAIHRNGMRQACTLKVREYISRGIPFFYAYDDPDISTDVTWALRFEGTEEPIEINRIIDFAKKVSRMNGLSLQMRKYASLHLEWRNKAREMYDFAVQARKSRSELDCRLASPNYGVH